MNFLWETDKENHFFWSCNNFKNFQNNLVEETLQLDKTLFF